MLQKCLLVIFATKPQVLPAVLAEVAPVVTTEHILVSVAAGVSLSTLEEVSGLWGKGFEPGMGSASHQVADNLPASLQRWPGGPPGLSGYKFTLATVPGK